MNETAKILLTKLNEDSTRELKNLLQDKLLLEKTTLAILELTEKTARKFEAIRKKPDIDIMKLKENIALDDIEQYSLTFALDGIEQYSLTFEPVHKSIVNIKYSVRQELCALDKENFIEIELAMLKKSMLDAHTFSAKLMETAGPRIDDLINKLANEFGEKESLTEEIENDTGCKIYPLNSDIDGITKN